MITIHGIPISVHTRKVMVAANLKGVDYHFEPVIPFFPPENWAELSPTGLIPVMEDDGFVLADSSAICHYLERKFPEPCIYPADIVSHCQAVWFENYAGGTLFREVIHGLFLQKIIRPKMLDQETDHDAVEAILDGPMPKVFSYLESRLSGDFFHGPALTAGDISIASNLINFNYLGFRIDAKRFPRLAHYVRCMIRLDPFARALATEEPFAERMGLDRGFLADPATV